MISQPLLDKILLRHPLIHLMPGFGVLLGFGVQFLGGVRE